MDCLSQSSGIFDGRSLLTSGLLLLLLLLLLLVTGAEDPWPLE
jgi:hypothetical protein